MVRTPKHGWRMLCGWILGVALSVGAVSAADTRPVVGPGATRDEVISAYGWPSGQSRLGTKEVLTYPQGSILITDGKVERVDFSPNIQWAAPKARPAPASGTNVKRAEVPTEFWGTSLADAMNEAQRRNARILAAFVGSDWSPPSKRFLDEVATSADFYNAFTADFVFLKVDFPTRAAQPTELKKQNEELRARCGVTTYPALIVLSPRGEPVGVADLNKERAGGYREQITEAVAAVRDLLKVRAPLEPRPNLPASVKSSPAPAGTAATAPAAPAAAKSDPRSAGTESEVAASAAATAVSSASWALTLGLGSGAVLAGLFVWWVWRTRVQLSMRENDGPKFSGPAVRLTDVPTPVELAAWPVKQVHTLVAAVFEATGYKARLVDRDGEATVELSRPGHDSPSVLVGCVAGDSPSDAKAVREFFGTMVSAGIDTGWMVAPGGFTTEAYEFAGERGIELIDGPGLVARLQAIDALVRDRILARVGV